VKFFKKNSEARIQNSEGEYRRQYSASCALRAMEELGIGIQDAVFSKKPGKMKAQFFLKKELSAFAPL
jgi:hypothetical protein